VEAQEVAERVVADVVACCFDSVPFRRSVELGFAFRSRLDGSSLFVCYSDCCRDGNRTLTRRGRGKESFVLANTW
jgi:hypothetical protein